MNTEQPKKAICFFPSELFGYEIPIGITRAFIISSLVTFAVFLVEAATFPYWDHDFLFLGSGSTFTAYWDGRWAGDILNFLTRFNTIPFAGFLWSIVFRTLAGILVVYYWTKTTDITLLVIAGVFSGISPECLSFLLYRPSSPIFFAPMLYCALSFLILEKNNKYFPFTYILTLLAVATYPPVLSMYSVVFVGKLIFDTLSIDTLLNKSKYVYMSLIVTLASVTQYFIVNFMIKLHVIIPHYNIEVVNFSDLPQKALEIFNASFNYFYPFHNAAYMPAEIKITILAILALSIIAGFCAASSAKKFVLFLFLLLLALISSKSAMILTPIDAYQAYRLTAHGSIFLSILIICLLTNKTKPKILRLISMPIIIFLFYNFFLQDSLFQRINRDQFLQDILFVQRIVSNIENADTFDMNKPYTFIVIGTLPYNAKDKYFNYNYLYSLEEFRHSTMMPSCPSAILQYVAPYLKVKNEILNISAIEDPILSYKIYKYADKNAWPNKGFVKLLNNDTIILVLDTKDLNKNIDIIKTKLSAMGLSSSDIGDL